MFKEIALDLVCDLMLAFALSFALVAVTADHFPTDLGGLFPAALPIGAFIGTFLAGTYGLVRDALGRSEDGDHPFLRYLGAWAAFIAGATAGVVTPFIIGAAVV